MNAPNSAARRHWFAALARDIFGDPHYAQRTKALADEIGALPTPAETVRTIEELTTD